MNLLEEKIKTEIEEYSLLRPEAPVIVAVSGGADSVALLCALHRLGYICVAAHCNFHLRGEESNRDMRFVEGLCAHLGIDLYMKDFDVESRCAQTGESVEMACRELRYRWFDTLLDRLRAQAIAVAHHREDNIETFFLNLMRGSSLTGLTGMRRRNSHVVRPMLAITRSEIEDYLAQNGIGYVTDSTNCENVYARNRLRNVVLPTLLAEFPGAADGILASIRFLTDNRTLYESLIAEKTEIYVSDGTIHLAELIRDQACPRQLLFEIVRGWGFNMSQVDDILASADKSGLKFSAKSTTLELDRGHLHIISRTAFTPDEIEVNLRRDILTPVNIAVTDHAVTDFRPERNTRVAYFDISVLDGAPRFALRRWRRGDRITPFGMRGSRLLSDIFSDAKFSAADKRKVWVLTRDGEIIWVVGVRPTDRFAVTPDTRRYLRLTLL